jgi:hypothetical protein
MNCGLIRAGEHESRHKGEAVSKGRRVGGSGWAGVHGSFVGLSKGCGGKSTGVRVGKRRKKPNTQSKIDLATLPQNADVQREARRVLAIQKDIEAAEKRFGILNSQLRLANDKLQLVVKATKPSGKHPTKKKADKAKKK